MCRIGIFEVDGFNLGWVFSSIRRQWILFSALAALCVSGFSHPAAAQVKSESGMILLRATLAQSLSVSAQPEGVLANAFLSTNMRSAVPVTFATKWVRGPASISLALVHEDYESDIQDTEPFAVVNSPDATEKFKAMEQVIVATWEMQFPETSKKKLLTVRAQAI